MKRLIFSMVFLCLLISSTQVQAQTWSAAEKEVVQAIDACMRAYKEQNLEAFMACFHDDFVGFDYGDPDTYPKADIRKSLPLQWARGKLVEWWVSPLAIRIVGDVAVIHYYLYTNGRDQEDKEIRRRSRWTEVMVKEDGNWVWIAEHGGNDPGVKPSGEQ